MTHNDGALWRTTASKHDRSSSLSVRACSGHHWLSGRKKTGFVVGDQGAIIAGDRIGGSSSKPQMLCLHLRIMPAHCVVEGKRNISGISPATSRRRRSQLENVEIELLTALQLHTARLFSNVLGFHSMTTQEERGWGHSVSALEKCILDSVAKSAGQTPDHLQNIAGACSPRGNNTARFKFQYSSTAYVRVACLITTPISPASY